MNNPSEDKRGEVMAAKLAEQSLRIYAVNAMKASGLTEQEASEKVRMLFKALRPTLSSCAARDAALEEAARICDRYAGGKWAAYKIGNGPDRANSHAEGESDGADECAKLIRAMKGAPVPESASSGALPKELIASAESVILNDNLARQGRGGIPAEGMSLLLAQGICRAAGSPIRTGQSAVPESAPTRDYCESCGYTDSHDPNCPRPKDDAPASASAARCPLGLDDTPTICSAATCASCKAWREYIARSSIAATVPAGWKFQSADFSMPNSGRVIFMRDAAGQKLWFSLTEEEQDRIPLYVWGEGATFEAAMEDARKNALAAPVSATEASKP